MPGHLETIAALLTPPGRGAVATIRVEGEAAVALVAAHFRPVSQQSLGETPVGRICLGRWHSAADRAEELVVFRLAESVVEVHSHGGDAAPRAILADLEAGGCRVVSWRDWTRLSTPSPLARAARELLSSATTIQTAAVLADQCDGALERELRSIDAHLAAGQFSDAHSLLVRLRSFRAAGMHLAEPFRVSLVGRPNAGKSSLLNALVGFDRAIVHATPGTTRDAVSAHTAIHGWPVELSDTAGLRTTSDPLEAAGIERTRDRLARADAVILVLDSTLEVADEDLALLKQLPQAIVAHSKCDLPSASGDRRPPGLLTSAVRSEGLAELLDVVFNRLLPDVPPPGSAAPYLAAHFTAIETALRALERDDGETARRAVGALLCVD